MASARSPVRTRRPASKQGSKTGPGASSGRSGARRRRGGPESAAEKRARTLQILDALDRAHPEARCALDYRNPFELLIATILSAQCTDERVNQVTPALFDRFPSAEALAQADLTEIEGLIRPTGFFRAKARSIRGCALALVAGHDGKVPRSMQELVPIPGIGRKTANVVLGHAFDIAEGIAVDTHVLRVSNRLGIASGEDALEVEKQLMALVPAERWIRTTDVVIFHGRKVCGSRRPDCGHCSVLSLCRWPERHSVAAETGD